MGQAAACNRKWSSRYWCRSLRLIVSLGAVVSTVAVTAAVVVVLPALSVALAVKLWLPSASAPVV